MAPRDGLGNFRKITGSALASHWCALVRQGVVGVIRGQSVAGSRAVNAAAAAVVTFEVIGFLSICGPIPFAWLWMGGIVYRATGSLAADLGVAFLGSVATMVPVARALGRTDRFLVSLRQRPGHKRSQGALTHVVAVMGTLVLVLFTIWYYVLSDAFVLPFMPTH
jgi:hypothetical protein